MSDIVSSYLYLCLHHILYSYDWKRCAIILITKKTKQQRQQKQPKRNPRLLCDARIWAQIETEQTKDFEKENISKT